MSSITDTPRLEITIPGPPIAKKRPRFFRKGSFVGTYNDQKTEEGRWLYEAQKQVKERIEGKALLVDMFFGMPIPKGTSKKKTKDMLAGRIFHIKRPDVDNLMKWVLDCFNGVAWDDDSRVVWTQARKAYSTEPKTKVSVVVLNESEKQ